MPRIDPDDEANARAFLAGEGAAFGVTTRDELRTVRVWSSPGRGGSAVFQRTAGSLPVFGGEVAVAWRADGAITLVNGARVLAAIPAGAFRTGAEQARASALGLAPGTPGASSVAQGWLQFEGALRPAYRVEHDATGPFDSFVSYVDGATGELLYRLSRKRTALPLPGCGPCPAPPCVCAYRDSPLVPPPPWGVLVNAPEPLPARELDPPGDRLKGTRTAAYDCLGRDDDPRQCTDQRAVAVDGSFLAAPDPTLRRTDDAFAEQSAYYHIDDHSRFLDSLDAACLSSPRAAGSAPRCFAERTPAGGIGFVPGYVNAFSKGAPYDNAFFSPSGGPAGSSGVMVYGQGPLTDVAYDAEIVYHELTHAAVDVTARFEELTDRFGVSSDPGAINEGTADTFAFAHVAETLAASGPIDAASCFSRYFGAAIGLACLRDAANVRTCRGNGPNDGRDPGRDGEIHDDGEIWSGFTWALLRAAHEHGLRREMAAALFRALEASGAHPTFGAYAATVRQAMQDAGLPQAALDFADCTIQQRDLLGCDERAVPLFSGERAQAGFYGVSGSANAITTAGQQYFVDVPCGATALRLQTGDGTGRGSLLVRYGRPIEFATAGLASPQHDWLVPANVAEVVLDAGGCTACSACSGTRTPFGPGRWYFLPTGTPEDAGGNTNVFQLGVSVALPPGQEPPRRVPYVIGASDSADEPNVCTWGITGPTPARFAPRAASSAPALECAAPVTPADAPASASCEAQLPAGSPEVVGRACGCGAGTSGGAAALALVLLALARRRAGGRRRE